MFQSESVKKTVRGTVFSESADDTFPAALNPSGEMILFGTAHSRLSAPEKRGTPHGVPFFYIGSELITGFEVTRTTAAGGG
ncbi:MAG: hypothetical protein IIY42_06180, partial [Ruminococcus sp.]|nr:hypothetical protein [Ruminococcus sp.]